MGSQPVEMMDREYEGQFGKQMVKIITRLKYRLIPLRSHID